MTKKDDKLYRNYVCSLGGNLFFNQKTKNNPQHNDVNQLESSLFAHYLYFYLCLYTNIQTNNDDIW